MKKITVILISLILFFLYTPLITFASTLRCYDNAEILTTDEKVSLIEMLDKYSENCNMDIVIVTTESTENQSIETYADNFYDNNGFRDNGVLLLVNMMSREYWISTTGMACDYFGDLVLDKIGDEVSYYLAKELYLKAFETFALMCEEYIYNVNGSYIDYNDNFDCYDEIDFNDTANNTDLGGTLIISLIIGFVVSFIYTSNLKAKMKTVGFKKTAYDYTVNNSLKISANTDTFLYRKISKKLRTENQALPAKSSGGGGGRSVHTSSSGRSHGGRGGHF